MTTSNKGMKLSNRGSCGRADWRASSMLRFAAYAQCWATSTERTDVLLIEQRPATPMVNGLWRLPVDRHGAIYSAVVATRTTDIGSRLSIRLRSRRIRLRPRTTTLATPSDSLAITYDALLGSSGCDLAAE